MVALTSITTIITTSQHLFSPLKSTVREKTREEKERTKPYLKAKTRTRDAYSSYHESCICAMSYFTIKWKAKERGNYECENALDILSNRAAKKKRGGRRNKSN